MRIRNWKKFQHFKDRRPPWIKLHREMLDQLDISLISDLSFRVLVFLWLLAAEDETMNGELPDIKTISFRLRIDEKKITKSIQELGEWIDYSDINLISDCQQSVPPETETETETETEKHPLPIFINIETWNDFETMRKSIKKPMTVEAKKRLINKLTKFKEKGHDIDAILCESIMNSWSGVFEPKGSKFSTPTDNRSPMKDLSL